MRVFLDHLLNLTGLVAPGASARPFPLTGSPQRGNTTYMIKMVSFEVELMRIRKPLLPLGPARQHRLRAYARLFHAVFSRADQRQRLEEYLHGLLDGHEGKNVEAIAARLNHQANGRGLAQALQHFVSVSPWDARRFLQCYRLALAPRHRSERGLLVVQDVVFARKGRHAVGVQRQLARSLGRKINCQVGVAVSQIGPSGFVPLALEIFLPASWLRDRREDVERTVPPEHRQHRSRIDIALRLLQDLRDEGWGNSLVAAEEGYASNSAFWEALQTYGWHQVDPATDPGLPSLSEALGHARAGFDWLMSQLGLDQFEGRSWHGWHHHVSLALAAYGFLLLEDAAEPGTRDATRAVLSV